MFSLRKQFSRTIQKRLRRLHHGVLRNNTNANIVRSVSSSPPSSGKFGVHPPAHAQTGSRGMNSTAMASVTAPEHRIDNLPARLPFVVGESYHGFTLTESNATPEFGVIVYKFAHKESGAEYVHFQRDDDENFFSVGIRTPPENDKGTAHILEHMVMAGSEKYHTRNVFFNINHRSLNTMMNALTAPEFTCYPFSTQNVKDFHNLQDYYLDSVFFPQLRYEAFLQEGYRLEITPELTHNGVVFNEMKGAMSSSASIEHFEVSKHLFPEGHQQYNSGGQPDSIKNITHADILAFHKKHYRPANAIFTSYGHLPPQLEQVSGLLQRYQDKNGQGQGATEGQTCVVQGNEYIDASAAAAMSTAASFTEPKMIKETCPFDPMAPPDRQSHVSSVWVIKTDNLLETITGADSEACAVDVKDGKEIELLGLALVFSLLTSGPGDPFYNALIDSNIGTGFSNSSGFRFTNADWSFGIGVKGTANDPDHHAALLQLFDNTLEQVAETGFDEEQILATLHRIELDFKTAQVGFGYNLVMRLLPNWVHGDDISAPLRINRHLQVIKQKLEEGPYFQSLIKKHLLGNTHRLNVVMKGDEDYVHRKNQFEESQLLDLSDKLSLEDRNDLSQDQTTLMMYQHEETDLSLIPSLSTDDLKKKVDIYDFHRTTLCGPASSSSSLHTPSLSLLQQPTNGIAYLRGLLHLQSPANPDGIAVPTRLRQYIPLLMEYLCQVDTENHSYVSLERTINRYTGGIATMNFALAGVHDLERHGEVVCLSTHAFDRNIGTMLNLSDEILCHSHFHSEASRERIKTLISNHAAMLSEDLMESPERIGYTHACSTLTSSCGTTEEWEGLSFLRFMNSINTENEAMQQAAEMLGELSANQNQNHAHHTNAGGVVDAVVDDIVPVSIDEVCQNLSELSVLLFGGGLQGMHRFLAHGDANTLDAMTTQLHSKYPTSSAESLSSSSASSSFSSSVSSSSSSPLLKTFVPLPIQVNHVSACVRTVPLLHADSAKIQVAAEILSHKFLLAEIREKGGAYGGGCHTAQGVLAFSSFRDPNCKETLNVFESCNDWLNVAGNVTEDDVQDALLSVFKSLESPQAPGEKGVGQWLTGITDDERQQFRDSLLGVKRADILEAGDKYFHRDVLQGKREGSRAAVTVIGDSANIEPEGNWTIHDVSR